MREHFRFDVEEYLLDYTKSAKTIDREIMARCLGVQSDKDELVIIYCNWPCVLPRMDQAYYVLVSYG